MHSEARFAAQSDPDQNPQFRRRWSEPDILPAPRPMPRRVSSLDGMGRLALVIAADFQARKWEGVQ